MNRDLESAVSVVNRMPAYEAFAKFYDAVMGDRARSAQYLAGLIRQTRPDTKSVLELACGTGSILKQLRRKYEVAGLDLSGRMLSIARRKVPQAKLFRQSMVDFHVAGRYDVICCVFDSINHITRFSDWERVFASVRRHLSPSGCFIFDINTQKKLDRHIAEPPWVHLFERNLLIMNVTALPKRASNWNIKVFEYVGGNRYALHEEDIVEVSFPSKKIVGALRRFFPTVRVLDPDRIRPSPSSERLFFIAALD